MKDPRIVAAVVGVAAAVLTVAAWRSDSVTSTSPQDGRDLFMRKGCASCHDGPQTTARVAVAPSLAEIADWAGRRPGLSAAEYVRESIINPPAFISPEFQESGPTAMPSLDLTETEVDALVTYLLAPDG